ncbi:DivIVA domain-containing protein [Kocuria sp. BT304]|uniref:DivIVA domain-containing protein n=1 Tax=Kocuria sp. BT304 TaxID=1702043 RepID=UPI000DD3EAC0|nr:DivIVA domain-containing protein [Kocuria sp. BT304]
MALTAEDVINKRFQPTKFREGYDQDEVDDFLDEVVVELRRLNQENETLRKQVETLGGQPETASADETGHAAGATTVAASQSTAHDDAASVSEPVAAPAEETTPVETTSAAPSAAPAPATSPTGTAASDPATAESSQSAAAVLAMAQKLHDDYVSQGQAERERLITEGRTQADHLVAEGKRTKEQTLSALETEKVDLEAAVAQLRTFEADYRSNLKSFLNGQLRDLDNTGSLAPTDASKAVTGKRTGTK